MILGPATRQSNTGLLTDDLRPTRRRIHAKAWCLQNAQAKLSSQLRPHRRLSRTSISVPASCPNAHPKALATSRQATSAVPSPNMRWSPPRQCFARAAARPVTALRCKGPPAQGVTQKRDHETPRRPLVLGAHKNLKQGAKHIFSSFCSVFMLAAQLATLCDTMNTPPSQLQQDECPMRQPKSWAPEVHWLLLQIA